MSDILFFRAAQTALTSPDTHPDALRRMLSDMQWVMGREEQDQEAFCGVYFHLTNRLAEQRPAQAAEFAEHIIRITPKGSALRKRALAKTLAYADDMPDKAEAAKLLCRMIAYDHEDNDLKEGFGEKILAYTQEISDKAVAAAYASDAALYAPEDSLLKSRAREIMWAHADAIPDKIAAAACAWRVMLRDPEGSDARADSFRRVWVYADAASDKAAATRFAVDTMYRATALDKANDYLCLQDQDDAILVTAGLKAVSYAPEMEDQAAAAKLLWSVFKHAPRDSMLKNLAIEAMWGCADAMPDKVKAFEFAEHIQGCVVHTTGPLATLTAEKVQAYKKAQIGKPTRYDIMCLADWLKTGPVLTP